jgi:hypothetical protein
MAARGKLDHKGRRATSRFARLDHKLLSSAAYRALSPNARSLLVELAMMENGRNNGSELFLSVRDAADRMGIADLSAASRAFEELQALGFIACTAEAHFAVKAGDGSRARFWRLTWQAATDAHGRGMAPTNEYESAQPEPGTREHRRMHRGLAALKRWTKALCQEKRPVLDFATRNPDRVANFGTTIDAHRSINRGSVSDSATRFAGNGGKPPNVVVLDSATYTASQLHGADIAAPGPNEAAALISRAVQARRVAE